MELETAAGKPTTMLCHLKLLLEQGVLLVHDASGTIPRTNVLLDWMQAYQHNRMKHSPNANEKYGGGNAQSCAKKILCISLIDSWSIPVSDSRALTSLSPKAYLAPLAVYCCLRYAS